ncbi:MAG: cytochrome c oxidase subunit 3 [Wenzhouxiangellaceae bacterium]|nr:cytochrome c oxidase subunit 3 [Wenzhouxiangellaceae bacterium]
MMTVTLIAIVALMATFLTWIVRQTINVQPWEATSTPDDGRGRLPSFLTTPRVGLIVVMAAITSLFALIISAYNGRMMIGSDWVSVDIPAILWGNTLVLVLSSMFLHLAWRASADGDRGAARVRLLLGGASALLFIAGQAVAWMQLRRSGLPLAVNPASAFFVLVTALHVLHLLGGLVAWVRAYARLEGASEPRRAEAGIGLCTIYWHFLLGIWLILFGLLLIT